jgi:hypothetical protein
MIYISKVDIFAPKGIEVEELVCRSCGLIQTCGEAILTSFEMKDGRVQIRADCYECGEWIKWVKKTHENTYFLNRMLERKNA